MSRTALLLIAFLAASVAWGQETTDPAAPLESEDWTVRLAAARQLLDDPGSVELAVWLELATDPEVAVSAVAYRALAEVGNEPALEALSAALKDASASRREAAALAVLLRRGEVEASLADPARLQVISENGRAWLAAKPLRDEVFALAEASREARERHRALRADARMKAPCIESLYARFGVRPESIESPTARFERYWREGRLESLRLEQERLQDELEQVSALNDEIDAVCWRDGSSTEVPPPGGGDPDPVLPGEGVGWTPVAPFHTLIVTARGWMGHDNNTFVLRPGLTVNEPGSPERGQPIDLIRDDTLFGVLGRVLWRFGETSGEGAEVSGYRGWMALSGSYEGRLRWGQLMGPTGDLELGLERFSVWEGQHSHLTVAGHGGLSLPDWWEEGDLDAFPGRRLGGELTASFLLGEPPPGESRRALPSWQVRYAGEAYTYQGNLGVEPPELWWTGHRLELVGTTGVGEPAVRRAGGVLDARVRVSEGGLADGISLAAEGLFLSYDMESARLEVELGYGVGIPLGGGLGVEHGPTGRGHFVWREYDGELYFEFTLDVEHGLRPVGRYGWLANTDEGELGFRVLGREGVRWFELALLGERGQYVLGGGRETGLVAGGMVLEFPVFPMEPLLATFRVDGRLAADDARFGGRLLGQLRVMLWVDFTTGDLL